MRNLIADLKYTLRTLRHSPVFTVTAVLTLALGLGGTTAIFSLIHAVMLRSLPVADPASLYRIGKGNDCCVEGGPQDEWGLFSYNLYQEILKSTPEFAQVAAFQGGSWQSSVRRSSERISKPLRSEFISGNYFSTFGIQASAGRLITEQDDQASAPGTAVLSYRAWQTLYAGDPGIIGSTFVVEGHALTIIGITPPGFYGETLRSDPPEIWLPLHQEPLIRAEGSLLRQSIPGWLRLIGRLQPGASVAGVGPRLTQVLRNWLMNSGTFPAEFLTEIKSSLPKQFVHVVPAGGGVAQMKEDYETSLNILLCVCGVVLLIACANTANLMLARGMARRTNISIRLAIGASRRQIVRHALVESAVLAILGGIAGLLIAFSAEKLILSLAFRSSQSLPIDVRPSGPVLLFALGLSLLTGLLFGVGPALFAMRSDPIEALRGSGRSTKDASGLSRTILLIAQATLSLVLIAGAGMLTRSLSALENQDLGYATTDRLTVSLNTPPATYSIEKLESLYRALFARLKQIPGVQQVSLALYNPSTDNWGEGIVLPDASVGSLRTANASWDRVSPEYFAAVGQPILRGRGFTDSDNESSENVAVVNQAFVRRFFPNRDPLDKRFGLDLQAYASTFRIVGVVRDAKYIDLRGKVRPMFFVPLAQSVTAYKESMMKMVDRQSHFIGSIMLVTKMDPGTAEPIVKRAFADVDPNLTLIRVRTMHQQVARNFDQDRTVATLAGIFGIVALVLASVGLYGVTAYSVAQRTSEIGIRMAMGAGRPAVVRLVLSGAFRNVAIGLVIGVPLAIGSGQLIASKLYGVKPWDPASLGAATAALAVCALIAASLPATRASTIDPMRALRTE